MNSIYLTFDVVHQVLTRKERNILASASQNYVHAKFNFSPDWDGLIKTAVFTKKSEVYNVILEEDACVVPYEILETAGIFTVSVFAGDRITTNAYSISVVESGYKRGITPEDPTPTVYEQIMEMLRHIESEIDPEIVKEVVDEYLAGKDFITAEEAEPIIAEIARRMGYVTKTEVDEEVERYVTAHKDELKGEPGKDGKTPTAEEIQPVVETVFDAHKSEFVTPTEMNQAIADAIGGALSDNY